MRNTFSSPEAFSAFEGLFHADTKDKGLSRTWRAFAEPDDENDDLFPQHYRLTENLVEPWTFQEMEDVTNVMEVSGVRNNPQLASQEFVVVGTNFFPSFICNSLSYTAFSYHITFYDH